MFLGRMSGLIDATVIGRVAPNNGFLRKTDVQTSCSKRLLFGKSPNSLPSSITFVEREKNAETGRCKFEEICKKFHASEKRWRDHEK